MVAANAAVPGDAFVLQRRVDPGDTDDDTTELRSCCSQCTDSMAVMMHSGAGAVESRSSTEADLSQPRARDWVFCPGKPLL